MSLNGSSFKDYVIVFFVLLLVLLVFFSSQSVFTVFVSVPTDSMEPNIKSGDLVTVNHNISNIETKEAKNEVNFGDFGDVIVYKHDGKLIIHRAIIEVEAGENWVSDVNNEFVPDDENCNTISSCPSSVDGFITKGDNTEKYDQFSGVGVVSKDDIKFVAENRVPYVGNLFILLVILNVIAVLFFARKVLRE